MPRLIGMSINFAVMFRLKFRFSNRIGLLACGAVLIAATFICANTTSVPLLVATCFVAGWFRMWATFVCNSTIQLWLTPVRDMAIFFCYVYLVVDGVIQLSGIATIYTAFFSQWEYMHLDNGWPTRPDDDYGAHPRQAGKGARCRYLCSASIGSERSYGAYSCFASLSSVSTATSTAGGMPLRYEEPLCWGLHVRHKFMASLFPPSSLYLHPALTNRNVVRASAVYLVFFTLMATEHVFEHSYAATILGFDETNLIDLNRYVLAGIAAGALFTYLTFATRKWRYKTMTAIGFALAALYLAWFYFMIDYGVEKEMLFLPLFTEASLR